MFLTPVHATDGKKASPAESKRCRDSLSETGRMRFTAKEVFFPGKLRYKFLRYDEIVWAYIRLECDTATIGMGYTSISVNYIVLRTADGREFVTGMPTDAAADEALNIISMYAVNARIGHTEENCEYFGVEKRKIKEGNIKPGMVEIPILKKRPRK